MNIRSIILHRHIFKNAGSSLDAALESYFGYGFAEFHNDNNDSGRVFPRELFEFLDTRNTTKNNFINYILICLFICTNSFAQSTDFPYVLNVNLIDSPEVKPSSVRDGIKKVFGNKFELSRFSENYSKKDQRISVKSTIEMPSAISAFTPIDSISRQSYTEVVNKSVQMLQVVERQGKQSPWEEARNDIKYKRVSFFKNGQKKSTEEYSGDLIDLVFLPYYWFGRPVEIKPLKVNVATSNSPYKDQVFIPSELKVNFLGKQMDVVRFVRQPKKANEFKLEIWVNKKDGRPVRVINVMNPEVGVQLDTYPVN